MLSRRSCPWERGKGRWGHYGVNAWQWCEMRAMVAREKSSSSRSKMAGKGWVHGGARAKVLLYGSSVLLISLVVTLMELATKVVGKPFLFHMFFNAIVVLNVVCIIVCWDSHISKRATYDYHTKCRYARDRCHDLDVSHTQTISKCQLWMMQPFCRLFSSGQWPRSGRICGRADDQMYVPGRVCMHRIINVSTR